MFPLGQARISRTGHMVHPTCEEEGRRRIGFARMYESGKNCADRRASASKLQSAGIHPNARRPSHGLPAKHRPPREGHLVPARRRCAPSSPPMRDPVSPSMRAQPTTSSLTSPTHGRVADDLRRHAIAGASAMPTSRHRLPKRRGFAYAKPRPAIGFCNEPRSSGYNRVKQRSPTHRSATRTSTAMVKPA